MAKRNINDTTGSSYTAGDLAEKGFIKTATRRGWTVFATREKDEHKHIDFFMMKDGTELAVEVKARKKICRIDDNVQDEWIWIEFHGREDYNIGWLHGEADIIAFEKEKTFLLVGRKDLLSLAYKLVDMTSMVDSPYDAQYKLYCRNKEHDLTSLIEMSEIDKIKLIEWEKE